MKFERYSDWDRRLVAFVESRRGRGHKWGVHDCALFVADAIEALTGVDPAADFRGTYDSQRGAERLIASYGGLDALVTETLGIEPSPPLTLRRGDIAFGYLPDQSQPAHVDDHGEFVHGGRAPAIGLVTGPRVTFPNSEQGLVAHRLGDMDRGWRIG